VKILYLKPQRGRPFFYADPAEVCATEAERHAGALTRLARKWDQIEARWKDSEGTAARWSRRVWDRMHAWCKPDEPLLAKLATVDAIIIHHPASIPEQTARAAWRRYLRARSGSHWFWLLIDGFLAPVTGLVLWILPGPNVISFWFAYRAYTHYTIVQAVRRARRSPPPVTFEADRALDSPVRREADGGWTHEAVVDPGCLRGYLDRRKPSDDPGEPELEDADSDAQPTGRA
jgi:hypothetical protein